MSRSIKRVCNLCEAMCGLTFDFNDDASYSIRGNKDDVFSKGAFCPKSQGLKDLHEDPDRLRTPLKRVGQSWEPVSWNEAFDDIAKRITELQAKSGRSSIATYIGNPNAHNFGNLLTLPLFFKKLRTHNQYSATSVDQLPHMLVALQMFGHQLLLPIADIDRAEYLLILGANPAVSNGSLLSSAGLSSKIKKLREGKGKVVVLDPRYTETASLASEHHFIRPGTDAFLLAGIVKILLDKHKIGAMESHIVGLESLVGIFKDVSLDGIEQATGVAQGVMKQIAHDLMTFETAICYGRFGVSTQAYGTVSQWLINLINILTGNFDRQGGVLFTKPAFDAVALSAKFGTRGSFGRRKSRVRGLPEFSGEYPSATLADEILTPGPGQVRGLITIAGNPVLSLPNGRKLEDALGGLDLYVAIDIYLNETTRFADYILPPTSSLEHSHFDLVFNVLATRNTIRYSPAVVDAGVDSREDWEILMELWRRLGPDRSSLQKFTENSAVSLLKKFGTDRVLDWGLRLGPYKGLSLKKLKANPDGIDLGPLIPSVPERLFTRDKKIHLVTEPLLEAWRIFRKDPLWQASKLSADRNFVLIGRRNLKSNNSWMHNLPSLQRQKDQCFVIMHEEDGETLGISDGSQVRLTTGIGSIELPVSLSKRIMPGVISVPHGWGHHRPGTRLNLAQQYAGVSLNDILDDAQIDAFSGNAVLNGQAVRITRIEHPAVP